MRRMLAALGAMGLLAGTAAAYDGRVYTIREQRAFFNTVKARQDLSYACDGNAPMRIETFHTVGDGFAAVFTGLLWTPAHLRVTCPAPVVSSSLNQ